MLRDAALRRLLSMREKKSYSLTPGYLHKHK